MAKLLGGLKSVFVFFAVFFFIFGLVLYVVLGRSAKEALIEQTLHREQSIVRAGANSVVSFLDLASKSLLILAKKREIVSLAPSAEETMADFVADWQSTPIVEIILVDREGILRFVSNRQGYDWKPVSVAERDYYLWAKEARKGEIFLGQPILPGLEGHRNQHVIPLATPVYQGDEFRGALVAIILLSDLTEDYLEPLKISEKTEIYLINSEGVLLHAPYEEVIAISAFDYLEEKPFLGSEIFIQIIREKLEQGEEGKIDIAYPDFYQPTPLKRMLVAYAPVRYSHSLWMLFVATPVKDALALTAPFYINQIAVLVIGFLVLIIISVVIARSRAYREGFIDYGRMLQRVRKVNKKKK